MPSILLQRDIGSSIAGVKTTFSGWDSCMSKGYCKWPVIIAIVIGSLIILSVVWSCVRCLCCGLECCCGCLACCNACCPSPRSRRSGRHEGYQQAPPTPHYNQYQQPPPPAYPPAYASGAAGYRSGKAAVPQTATFETPSKSTKISEDALPAMPSWDNATSRKVEQPVEDVEMEKLDQQGTSPESQMLYQNPEPAYAGQQDSLLPKEETGRYYDGGSTLNVAASRSGDIGTTMNAAARPYHGYQQQQQFSSSPYGSHYQNRGPASPSPYGSQILNRGPNAPSMYSSQDLSRRPNAPAAYSSQDLSRRPNVPAAYSTQDLSRRPNAPVAYSSQDLSRRPVGTTPYPLYESTHEAHDDSNAIYSGTGQRGGGGAGGGGYEASIPPSYHTTARSDAVSPITAGSPEASYPGQPQYQAYGASNNARTPAQGSWREV